MASKSARGRGRPEIPPDEVARQQELYLSLLRLGKTEIEINAVDGCAGTPVGAGSRRRSFRHVAQKDTCEALDKLVRDVCGTLPVRESAPSSGGVWNIKGMDGGR
jgi:hypothetical protein